VHTLAATVNEADMTLRSLALYTALVLAPLAVSAADFPAPHEADWTAKDFRFHDGQILAELHEHYITIGDPHGMPVLILHGTAGAGADMLAPEFAGQLFGPGQPLDATRYFIILPDAIGAGRSAKPSDGLRTKFPRYDLADMVAAQYRLLTEGLGLRHLRLVLGNSMGGMQTWEWGVAHPDFMDALIPMASQPTAMAGRNWMLRRMLIETIRQDPAYDHGNYATQPPSLRLAAAMFAFATTGGTLALQAQGPTHALADQTVIARPGPADANDFTYQWDASFDHDPAPFLARITAPVLAINSADDERNPPETGLTAAAIRQLKNGQLYLIPASAETHGHSTTGYARFWAAQLREFLQSVPAHAPM
jgi:homoserine O-acetyltransferase